MRHAPHVLPPAASARAPSARRRRGVPLARLLSLCLLLAPGALVPEARAGAPEACAEVDVEAVVAGVQARYDAIQDLEARFEQRTRSVMMGGAGLGDEAPTTGRVQIAKPGRMRWHYQAPRESLVLSDGETLWIYDVAAKEVTRARVTSGYLAGAALQFLLGEGAIVDAFSVALLDCDARGAGEGASPETVSLELLPKEDAPYEKLAITVDRERVVVATTIYDLFGNVTELRFDDVRFDRAPRADRFRWQPVDGVRVVDLEPASAP